MQQHTPPGRQALRDSHVTAFHRQHPNWVQSRVDKNAHLSVLICRSTFARRAHTALTASGNYRLYRSYRDAREATAVYMLAWYMFCNIVPVLRAHVPLRSMRSMLTRVVPQLRGVRLRVPQLDTPGHLAAADEWRTFKDTVFTHSLTIFQEAEEKNPLYLRPCPTPHGQRAVRLWKVPSVIISVKGKSLPCPDIVEAKLREIFTHAAHPTRLFFRRVSRALSVLVRTYTKTFFALEVVDQADLITSFLHPARQWYREHNIPCAAFELDLDRMFPNIERHAVPQAYEDLAKRYIQLVGMNRLQSSVYVSIAKGGARDLDCLGKKDTRFFYVYSLQEIH